MRCPRAARHTRERFTQGLPPGDEGGAAWGGETAREAGFERVQMPVSNSTIEEFVPAIFRNDRHGGAGDNGGLSEHPE